MPSAFSYYWQIFHCIFPQKLIESIEDYSIISIEATRHGMDASTVRDRVDEECVGDKKNYNTLKTQHHMTARMDIDVSICRIEQRSEKVSLCQKHIPTNKFNRTILK